MKLLKELKLLESDLSSASYLPKHFSFDENKLNLVEGSWLGEEEMIVFDQENTPS